MLVGRLLQMRKHGKSETPYLKGRQQAIFENPPQALFRCLDIRPLRLQIERVGSGPWNKSYENFL